jgi:glycosyltransferase involved in cell wall biosynthesis
MAEQRDGFIPSNDTGPCLRARQASAGAWIDSFRIKNWWPTRPAVTESARTNDSAGTTDQRRRLFVIASDEPYHQALFEALEALCSVQTLAPRIGWRGWLPSFGRRRRTCDLPRGAFSRHRWLVRILAPLVERRLLAAYGRADALIITDPHSWPYAIHYRRLASVITYLVSDDYAAYPHVRLDQEHDLVRHADLILPVSRRLAEVLQARYRIEASRIRIVPNGIPASWLPAEPPTERSVPPAQRPALPVDLVPADFRPLIGIIGVFGSRIDLGPIVAAHDALPQLRWLFVGPVRRQLPGLAHLQSSPRCRFLGPLPYERLQPCFATLDAAVLPLTDGDINPCSSPVRFFSQLPTGQPILYTGTCAQIAETPHLAYHCADGQALTATLERLAAAGFQDGRAAERHRFATGCTWPRRAEATAAALEAVLEARRRPAAR